MADVPRSARWVIGAAAIVVAATAAVTLFEPDEASLGTETTIDVGDALGSLTFVPTAGGLFGVTDAGVMIVDPTRNLPPRRLRVATNVGDGSVAVDPVANTVWVSDNDRTGDLRNRRLSILDITTGRFVETMMLPHPVIDIAIDAAARRAFVIHRAEDQQNTWITVSDIDSRDEITTLEVPFAADDVSLSPSGDQAVVTGRMGATLLSTDELAVHDVGIRPSGPAVAAVHPDSRTAYVFSSDTLYTVDLEQSTVTESMSPAQPGRGQFVVDPDGRLVVVDADGVLKVVDPGSLDVLATRQATEQAQVAVDPESDAIFVADNNELTVIERP